ncbi:hypothetical protein B0H10DRAFT_2223055 [Mycena sp. CBHHK59/15]|nr:hypothetical protein B0H10DRAFT_2223055 [Mycena sp. CBHHK59/15]
MDYRLAPDTQCAQDPRSFQAPNRSIPPTGLRIIDMKNTLAAEVILDIRSTKELEAIIAAGADWSQRAIPDHRGTPPSLTSQRGKKRGLRTRSGGQALPRLREDGSESEAEPEAHDDSAPPSALLPSESQGMRSAVKKSVYLGSKDLIDKSFKCSQAILQDQVSRSFSYLNPMFEATVSHLTNQHLFDEVAKQVTAQLHGREFWPDGLAIPDIDAQWRVQVDDEAARMNAANLMTIEDMIAAKGKQSTAARKGHRGGCGQVQREQEVGRRAVAQQHMSDEVSGPEDANDTSKAVWTTRMTFKTGLEVLECPWRSDEMTAPLHDLSTIASGLLSENERQKIQLIRVPDTGRHLCVFP